MLTIEKNNNESISDLVHKLNDLKDKCDYYRRSQEIARHNILMWNPYDGMDKDQHEKYWICAIRSNKYILNNLQKEIKELRKNIKKINREQNAKNNIRRHK